MLHLYDPEEANKALEQGATADQQNPHPEGSFFAYCWWAGHGKDPRSIEALYRDWING